MPKFRKKPVVIEAFKYDANEDAKTISTPRWFVDALLAGKIIPNDLNPNDQVLLIQTLEGAMTASPGDYIIQGVKGEIYPCKPDIFAATYDPA